MGFPSRKSKCKPKQKKTRLQWTEEKLSWTDWMKVIISEESPICIWQRNDAGTCIWCRSSGTYKEDCLKTTSSFPQLTMMLINEGGDDEEYCFSLMVVCASKDSGRHKRQSVFWFFGL